MPCGSERTVDEAKIQNIFAHGAGSPRAHREIVVIDDLQLETSTVQSAAASQSGVNPPGAARLRHFMDIGLEKNMFTRLQARRPSRIPDDPI